MLKHSPWDVENCSERIWLSFSLFLAIHPSIKTQPMKLRGSWYYPPSSEMVLVWLTDHWNEMSVIGSKTQTSEKQPIDACYYSQGKHMTHVGPIRMAGRGFFFFPPSLDVNKKACNFSYFCQSSCDHEGSQSEEKDEIQSRSEPRK